MLLLENFFLLNYCTSVFVKVISDEMTKFFIISLRMQTDFKITKKHYPRSNNESVLEFVFEKDPNLFMRKNKIKIFGTITVPKTCLIDTGYATKLFSMLTVEVDSQLVSNNRSR